jgi:hypothetical protein
MFKHLDKFAAKKGFLYLKQLDLNALREFRESWKPGPRTAMKKLERVKAFLRFATENEWIHCESRAIASRACEYSRYAEATV